MMPDVLAADLAAALDAVTFAHRLGFEPDPWQAALLRAAPQNALWNCCRQSGKSTLAALLAYHQATFLADSLVLVLSPSLRQSGELFRKVSELHRAAGAPAPQETQLTLTLANNSRIVSLPGTEKTIRGYSGATLLLVDEAARCDDDLFASVLPMLAVSGGRMICASTPFGKRGFFWQEWSEGGDTWQRVRVPATEVPRISPAFLEQVQRTIGEHWFRQEFMCEFLDAQTAAFAYDDIAALFGEEVEPWSL